MEFEMPTDSLCFSSLTQRRCPSSAQCVFALLYGSPSVSREELFAVLSHVIVGICTLQTKLVLKKFLSVFFIMQEQKVNACVLCGLLGLVNSSVICGEVAQS